MAEFEAPAKINLDLRVGSRRPGGMHPVRSLIQTIDWCDRLTIEAGEQDRLAVEGEAGAGLGVGSENLIWRALAQVEVTRPPLDITLVKEVAVAAGLGGGSSDAAAALTALGDLIEVTDEEMRRAASATGADVAFFLTGGTALMEGHGEVITPQTPLKGFAVAVAVPPFELSTAEVYGRWDELGEPRGDRIPEGRFPPALRGRLEGGNDLLPAALALRPDLGDWMADLAAAWGRPVAMSGSGPACFAFFLDLDEAGDALGSVGAARATRAASPRGAGVSRLEA